MKQTDITKLIYPDPMIGYTVWWCTTVQDQESLFTRMELELEQTQLKWIQVPNPVEMVMCSLAEEILEVHWVWTSTSTYVDELKMYNRQLSEAEICKMY